VTQVPLVYFLASKVSLFGHLSGTSFERLHWAHRWVSRTLLVTATVHGWFFFREWYLADFVAIELELMPMVNYGMGAWAILVWNCVTSFAPIRRLGYEIFVVQHVVAAVLLLWLLYVHVPSYAVYNIWISVGVFAFDRAARAFWSLYQNAPPGFRTSKRSTKWFGYDAELQSVADNVSLLSLKDVTFKWKAGQFFYLWIPRIGPFESHPFTVANVPWKTSDGTHGEADFVIRAHSGFTKRLNRKAISSEPGKPISTRVMVAGPFGRLPTWGGFESLVLISAGTGASFTLPILQSVLDDPGCVRTIDFILSVKKKQEAEYYITRLFNEADRAESCGISLKVKIAVTAGDNSSFESVKDIEHTGNGAHKENISETFVSESSSTSSWRESWNSQEASCISNLSTLKWSC
jgi:predicted ferric reductase